MHIHTRHIKDPGRQRLLPNQYCSSASWLLNSCRLNGRTLQWTWKLKLQKIFLFKNGDITFASGTVYLPMGANHAPPPTPPTYIFIHPPDEKEESHTLSPPWLPNKSNMCSPGLHYSSVCLQPPHNKHYIHSQCTSTFIQTNMLLWYQKNKNKKQKFPLQILAHTLSPLSPLPHGPLERSTKWIIGNDGKTTNRWILRFVLKEAREGDWWITDEREFQMVGAWLLKEWCPNTLSFFSEDLKA